LKQPSTSKDNSDIEGMSSDSNTEGEASSSISGPLPFQSIPFQPSQRHWNRSEDEVEEDIISISSVSGKKFIHIFKSTI